MILTSILACAPQRINNNFFLNVKKYEEYIEYSKCIGSNSNAKPKIALSLVAKMDLIALGLTAKPDPISLGLTATPKSLEFSEKAKPNSIGSSCQARLNAIDSGNQEVQKLPGLASNRTRLVTGPNASGFC